jgi:DNA-binding transcriptional regulator YiaG
MMSKESSTDLTKARPYPRHCAACDRDRVVLRQIPYEARVRHDGKLHSFHITALEVDECENCGEQYFTVDTDEQVSLALRSFLGLLSPNVIRAGLAKCSVNQRTFAEHLGIAPETVCRWLSGAAIQTRSMDNLMRLYFSLAAVREALANPQSICAEGATTYTSQN